MAAPERDLAAELVLAIHTGDVDAVSRLISESPALARGPLGGRFETRTALHVVCDRPGYFPSGPEVVRRLMRPVPTLTTGTRRRGRRRRCTGRQAATTWMSPPR